jgi:sulfoxide reductase catalytic subunit YedY
VWSAGFAGATEPWGEASEGGQGPPPSMKTLMFNGYAEQVGSMYSGMDLKKYY